MNKYWIPFLFFGLGLIGFFTSLIPLGMIAVAIVALSLLVSVFASPKNPFRQ